MILPANSAFVVRLYDGFDNEWVDVSKEVPWEEANRIWNEKTKNGTEKTKYGDIDYYAIFSLSDGRMRAAIPAGGK